MKTEALVRRVRLPVPAGDAWDWHARPGAFDRLCPPWEDIEVISRSGGIADGARVTFKLKSGPFGIRWVAEHRDCVEGVAFRDVQVEGPFARWDHRHALADEGAGSVLEDRIEYDLPLGAAGRLVAGSAVRRRLERMIDYRHRVTREDLAAHAAAREMRPMRILVSGSSGLLGTALVPFLTTGGHAVARLVRSRSRGVGGDVAWEPATGAVDTAGLEGADAVVHLAGENIAAGRWSRAKKARIRQSRVGGTRLLSEAIARLRQPPRVMVCASAVGFYGDRGDETLTEESPPGNGFLPDVCGEWEAATAPACGRGMRIVHLRFGMILTPRGGALARMLPPFRLGLGGRIGTGSQYWSWVSVNDAIGAVHHALANDALSGPVNVVAPEPVTNAEFTSVLGRVLSRPTVLPLPAFAARLALGEMADALLLSSARVVPGRLTASGYRFRNATLEDALRHLLGRTGEPPR